MGSEWSQEQKPQRQEGAMEDSGHTVDPDNGLILNGTYLPPEIVTHILAYVEPFQLVTRARRVCRNWRDIVENSVWWEMLPRESPGTDSRIFSYPELTWKDYYLLCRGKPFSRNLLKNGSGTAKMKFWITKQAHKGNTWAIENKPIGSDPFPKGETHCFATSFDWCSAEQFIILSECGLSMNFMNTVRPNIHIEEWYAGRFDCGFEYSIKVTLLSFNWEVIDTFTFSTEGFTQQWSKVEHTFRNYPKGVAYLVFHHKGKDTQFWAGHYGSKMTGAKVYLSMPDRAPAASN